MITGKVSSTPRNAYLRCVGKGFNSILGAYLPKVILCPQLVANFKIWVPTHLPPLPHCAQL